MTSPLAPSDREHDVDQCRASFDHAFAIADGYLHDDLVVPPDVRAVIENHCVEGSCAACDQAVDQAREWTALCKCRAARAYELPSGARAALVALIGAHPRALEAATAPSRTIPVRPVAAAGRPARRIGGPPLRWLVPLASAAVIAVMVFVVVPSDASLAQASIAQAAVTDLDKMEMRWVASTDGGVREMIEAFVRENGLADTNFLQALPDISDQHLMIKGATDRHSLAGRDTLTIVYDCRLSLSRCYLHVTRLKPGENFRDILGTPCTTIPCDEVGALVGEFWRYTDGEFEAIAWHGDDNRAGYVFVIPKRSLAHHTGLPALAAGLRFPALAHELSN